MIIDCHGHYYDDTKRYLDVIDFLSVADKQKIFEGNVAKVYPRFPRRGSSGNACT